MSFNIGSAVRVWMQLFQGSQIYHISKDATDWHGSAPIGQAKNLVLVARKSKEGVILSDGGSRPVYQRGETRAKDLGFNDP